MDKKERADLAARLMTNPLVDTFFEQYKENLFNRWLKSNDVEYREELHRLAIAGDAFRMQMASYLADGRLEDTDANT